MYQYKMHKQLADYCSTLSDNTNPDLQVLSRDANKFYVAYKASPDSSFKAQSAFYNNLYKNMSDYYRTHYYAKKTTWQKIKYFFGTTNAKEASFLKTKRAAKKDYQRCQKVVNKNWQLSTELRIALRLNGDNKEMVSHPSRFTKTKTFGAKKAEYNLRLVAHWLMGDKDFSEYECLQGLSSEFMAYKLKRELEKFRDLYSTTLAIDQLQQLIDAIKMLEAHLKIHELLALSSTIDQIAEQTGKASHVQARLDDIAYEVCVMLSELKNGGRLLIPHGYRVQTAKDRSGHAALVEAEKVKDDKFNDRFINTGSGAIAKSECKSFSDKFNKFMFGENPAPEYAIWRADGTTFDQHAQDGLVKQILSPLVLPANDKETAIQDMLKPMATFIDQGKLKKDVKIQLQANGTCTHASLLAWLQTVLDEDLMNGFELFAVRRANIKLTTLVNLDDVSFMPKFEQAQSALADAGKSLQAAKVRIIGREYADAKDEASSTQAALLKKFKDKAGVQQVIDGNFVSQCRQQIVVLEQQKAKIPSVEVDAKRGKAAKALTTVGALLGVKGEKEQQQRDLQRETLDGQIADLKETLRFAEKHCAASSRATMLNLFINPPQTSLSTAAAAQTPRARS